MLKLSTTQFQGHSFTVVYDTHIVFAGFFPSTDIPMELKPFTLHQASPDIAQQVCAWYLGTKAQLPLPLRVKGTEFQQSVWDAISSIPSGKVLTYLQLATSVNRPKAYRAVATACGKNPISLIVPCHRVVGVQGLRGYRWGLHIKDLLLKYEVQSSECVAKS